MWYHDEGLILQGGSCLVHPSALLQVLLQSQRVDGEEGHVGLKKKHRTCLARKQSVENIKKPRRMKVKSHLSDGLFT